MWSIFLARRDCDFSDDHVLGSSVLFLVVSDFFNASHTTCHIPRTCIPRGRLGRRDEEDSGTGDGRLESTDGERTRSVRPTSRWFGLILIRQEYIWGVDFVTRGGDRRVIQAYFLLPVQYTCTWIFNRKSRMHTIELELNAAMVQKESFELPHSGMDFDVRVDVSPSNICLLSGNSPVICCDQQDIRSEAHRIQ